MATTATVATTLVLGAGVAGLTAARDLREAGHHVVLLEAAPVPGGRLATHRIGDAVFDTGAQFLTTKSERFARAVARWTADGVAQPWFHGSPDLVTPQDPDGYPRYRGRPTMRRLAEHLASGLDVCAGITVDRIVVEGHRVALLGTRRADAPALPATAATAAAVRASGEAVRVEGDALLLTAPVPRTLELLDASGLALDASHRTSLDAIDYQPCLTVLAVPDGRTMLPARGALRLADGPVTWLTDNHATGASPSPAVTVHGTGAASRELWDAPDDEVARILLAAAAPHLGARVRAVHVHRWREAGPTTRAEADALLDLGTGVPIAIAGDGLVGGRVEGAALSGWAAAAALRDVLPEGVAA